MVSDLYTIDFAEIGMGNIAQVGGKNASLGELFNHLKPLGVNVLDGFATTSAAYRRLLEEGGLKERLEPILSGFDAEDTDELQKRGHAARNAILETPLPEVLKKDFVEAYKRLCARMGCDVELAVRSSATAEDLPEASFAGAAETFLNVRGEHDLLRAIHRCFASLFTDRAINYRAHLGYDQMKIALSVGVQPMIRSDLASSGVIFTLDTESGFREVVEITGAYGLGEYVVQGVVTPDEWTVFKPTLLDGYRSIISRNLGTKEMRLVRSGDTRLTKSEPVAAAERAKFSLFDEEVLTLARWACLIEKHYSEQAKQEMPMDIEWAKDGISGELFILQARPETVHSAKKRGAFSEIYKLKAEPSSPPIVRGQAVGERIGAGPVRIVNDVSELSSVQPGDILIAQNTNPDWEPVMKRVAGVVTNQGGRTAHAAIVSRELGLPCIVGTGNATAALHDCKEVTVCCSEGTEGHVYKGKLEFTVEHIDLSSSAQTNTKVMFNIADPSQAFSLSAMPNDGVGLARIEFIITNHIGVHPMALVKYPNLEDKEAARKIKEMLRDEKPEAFFTRRLAEGVGKIAAAFYPKPVIVRMSDFKTNEYARLLGGAEFEPSEENPMLGFRGASRYYDERYCAGFALECAAIKKARDEMGLTNIKVMIPFCRTVAEARKVLAEMEVNGLKQAENGLEVYVMCELPSNVVCAADFLSVFDGYSIGSNDLTQLILGIDRDSGAIASLFDEEDKAVKDMIATVIKAAHQAGKPIGICGQAPSDKPGFAAWLVKEGITSISLNPDTAIKTSQVIAQAESSTQSQSAKTV